MMYKRASMHAEICVIRVDPTVLDLKGVVIADANAASKYTAFFPSPAGLARVDESWVFADDWTDGDQIIEWRKKAAKCAEVLVPSAVPPDKIIGAYVSCTESQQALASTGFNKTITINPHFFFRG